MKQYMPTKASSVGSQSQLAIFGGIPVSKAPLIMPSPIGIQEEREVHRVFKKGILSRAGRGETVRAFEGAFTEFFRVPYAVSTTSGTTALHTALCALGIGQGDEVIVPALTFISTASVVLQQGAKAVFADVVSNTFCLDVRDIEKKITKRTKAIIVVHMYGCPADMKNIVLIAKKHGLKIIEDCAQAHGAMYGGAFVGTVGDIGCFSFYQTKIMTCGEGGMVVTKDPKLFQLACSVVDHGITSREQLVYDYDRLGFNYHMTEMQAAVGLAQLRRLPKLLSAREKNVAKFLKGLRGTSIQFQDIEPNGSSVHYALTALLPQQFKTQRDWFLEAVRAEGVLVNCLYPKSLPETKLLSRSKADICPVAEDVTARLFNFYINPGVMASDIRTTILAVKKVLAYLEESYE